MTAFTPLTSFAGGLLIGLSAVLMLALEGRIAGISGIASRLFPPWRDGLLPGRLAFIAGLVAAPFLVAMATGQEVVQTVSAQPLLMGVAGLLVGFGSVWGSGCTSGHGVCGLARLSKRSMVATAVFMAAGFLTVFVTRHVIGG
ncbi:YeeE/YedE family protein [Ancylobacter radicis]|uniref:YeeE/YedE family protein n=1 Tax=Ancylobacter radicis TaxID=2836179 RepID=A0ABS5R3Z4_9HYPH|nr:YeeE/YedE thiosulfate transporter family protein [Ancylobacter radicis]MBS9476380.1 YeeE/YedE family protein [Ancylobacter radicis]